jgi:hypothetical protein
MSDTKKYTKDLVGSGIGPIRMPSPPMQGPVVKRKEPGTIKPKISLYEESYRANLKTSCPL